MNDASGRNCEGSKCFRSNFGVRRQNCRPFNVLKLVIFYLQSSPCRPSSQSPLQMSCFASKGLNDDRIDYVLDGARNVLDLGSDALSLSPIPGLNVAAGALSFLIGMVQVRLILAVIAYIG